MGAESGEEDKMSKEHTKDEIPEANDVAWEGWDEQDNLEEKLDDSNTKDTLSNVENSLYLTKSSSSMSHTPPPPISNNHLDVNSLDIKVSGGKHAVSGEDDFFADMEPAIPSSLCLLDILEGKEKKERENFDTQTIPTETVGTKFAVAEVDADTGTDGWGEDDWGEDF